MNMYFQEEITPNMIGIRDLHDDIIYYIIIITISVIYFLLTELKIKGTRFIKIYNHSMITEFIWTISPSLILIFIAIPSFKFLYSMNTANEILKPLITIKIKGHQWYWSYEINDNNNNIYFESYMKSEDELLDNDFRLLSTDNILYLPINTPIRLLISAEDVIHSWAIPSFGIKIDGIPGRINQGGVFILKEGHFFGQCSELCGQLHAFMPIEIKSVNLNQYLSWLKSF